MFYTSHWLTLRVLQGTIYSFMRFPRGFPSKLVSVNLSSTQPHFPSYDIDIPTNFSGADMSLLEKLVTFSNGIAADKMVRTSFNSILIDDLVSLMSFILSSSLTVLHLFGTFYSFVYYVVSNRCVYAMYLLSRLDQISVMQPKAALHHNVLVRVAHYVANAKLMDKESFKVRIYLNCN